MRKVVNRSEKMSNTNLKSDLRVVIPEFFYQESRGGDKTRWIPAKEGGNDKRS